MPPTLIVLDAELALWRRRYKHRDQKLKAAHQARNAAELEHWGGLFAEAVTEINRVKTELSKLPHVTGHQVVSGHGINFIKGFEGYVGHPYQDSVGVWTIGYGHTENVSAHSAFLTENQASILLGEDLDHKYAPPVNALELAFTQNEFDALVSFVYNLGPGVLQDGSVGRDLRSHDYRAAADAILLYNHAGGQVLEGLTRRRQAERALFLTP